MNNLSPAELVLVKKACEITREALNYAEKVIKPGISTKQLDNLVEKFIIECGGYPACKGYEGFPGSICTSVNDMVVHGIPSEDVILQEGDIISVDIVVRYKGYHGDAARTFPVGKISEEKARLIEVTKQ